jgi:hypothetical protein
VARSPLVCSCRVVMVMLQLYIHMKGRSKKQHKGAPLPGVCVLWDGHARSWGQPGADCWLQVTRPQPLADYAAGHGSSAHAYSTVVPWLAAALGTVCVWPTQVVGASVAGGFLNTTSHMGWRGGGGGGESSTSAYLFSNIGYAAAPGVSSPCVWASMLRPHKASINETLG